MDGYTLERLVLIPSHEKWRPPQGAPTTQPLYQGAENAGTTKDRRVARTGATMWSARSRVLALPPTKIFLAIVGLQISCDKVVNFKCLFSHGV